MKEKGFTLIELMIVVVIIGILSSIAIPKFTSIKEQANQVSCRSNIRQLANAESIYFAYYSSFCGIATLESEDILSNSTELRCPTNEARYNVLANIDSYSVNCPGGAANHGSITDGISSWQGD